MQVQILQIATKNTEYGSVFSVEFIKESQNEELIIPILHKGQPVFDKSLALNKYGQSLVESILSHLQSLLDNKKIEVPSVFFVEDKITGSHWLRDSADYNMQLVDVAFELASSVAEPGLVSVDPIAKKAAFNEIRNIVNERFNLKQLTPTGWIASKDLLEGTIAIGQRLIWDSLLQGREVNDTDPQFPFYVPDDFEFDDLQMSRNEFAETLVNESVLSRIAALNGYEKLDETEFAFVISWLHAHHFEKHRSVHPSFEEVVEEHIVH